MLFAEDFCVLTVLNRRETRCFTTVNGVLTLSTFLVNSGMFHMGLFVCLIIFFYPGTVLACSAVQEVRLFLF